MNYEENVRKSAAALKAAVVDAEANGLAIAWPGRAADLDAIGISETGKAKVAVTVQVDDVDPKVASKAADAAQKAADRVIEKAVDKT